MSFIVCIFIFMSNYIHLMYYAYKVNLPAVCLLGGDRGI